VSSQPLPTLIASTLLAYFIGGLPFGYWFVRLRLGKDIRTMGSGNIGATNVHRTAGGKAGLIVLLLDILKGLLAVYLGWVITHGDPVGVGLAAAAVVVGHCYPALLKFRGGKGVACFIGAFGFIAPQALLFTALGFFLVLGLSRYVSLGSIVGAFIFPIIFWKLNHPPPPLLRASIAAVALIIYRHRANIVRLLTRGENRFSFQRKLD
jgi:glycerol-3-phosphate acyltransferase PlsY